MPPTPQHSTCRRARRADPGSDGTKDVKDLKDTAGTTDSGSAMTEVLAKDVTQDSAKGSGAARSAASSTADPTSRIATFPQSAPFSKGLVAPYQ